MFVVVAEDSFKKIKKGAKETGQGVEDTSEGAIETAEGVKDAAEGVIEGVKDAVVDVKEGIEELQTFLKILQNRQHTQVPIKAAGQVKAAGKEPMNPEDIAITRAHGCKET